jgi:hypothetical protein
MNLATFFIGAARWVPRDRSSRTTVRASGVTGARYRLSREKNEL